MELQTYSIKNLNPNKFIIYLRFYKLLFNKKFYIKDINFMLYFLMKFIFYYSFLGNYYLFIYINFFYKNILFTNKFIYIYILNKSKYNNINLFNNLFKNAFFFKKNNFLFLNKNAFLNKLLNKFILLYFYLFII
jgi:hypothetical protein